MHSDPSDTDYLKKKLQRYCEWHNELVIHNRGLILLLYLTIIFNSFVCLFVCFFNNFSQTIRPKGLKFSGFDAGHPGVVIRKFSGDQSKTLPVGLFLSKCPGWGHNSIPE